ncbi:hypothetical protein [Pseudoflavonifractor sp. MCC625]|uniref:hypothetical protein n=1 Tax=Pseudoflavonifractor sp. MCC625 TaxID=2592647 RepID=UPI001C0224DE|nr:hypothetical protein [Pseudoflavonifractor sp. MCC625]MBT9685622.1 hypothetical protein [Pseudoflavonifractor sp. MCC625]
MKMIKRVCSLALALMMLCSAGALAAEERWDSRAKVYPDLFRSGSTLTCELDVNAMDTSDKISANISLAKQRPNGSWEVLDYWTGEEGTGALNFRETYTSSEVTSGTYRLSYTVTVTSSKGSDVIEGEKEVNL